MNWNNKPFLLYPAGKDYLWGGDRLKKDFHNKPDLTPLAETWECSVHPDGTSIAASGEHKGKALDVILREHPEYLGSHPTTILNSPISSAPLSDSLPVSLRPTLPVLIKFIDAREKLSIQVHPDDAYANEHENGSLGKTEMWYVLDAVPGAELIYGFSRDMDPEKVRRCLQQGRIEKYLQHIPVRKNDIFFISPGTVHAIGAGVLLAEIQENSNLTYRLYDYDRTDKNGTKRPLHIEKALDVLHMKSSENPRQPMRVLRYRPGCAFELLGRCKYFQVERLLLNTAGNLEREISANNAAEQSVDCTTDTLSFRVLLCLEGAGKLLTEIDSGSFEILPFQKGDCIFLPANSPRLTISGNAQLLRVSC